MRAFVAVLVVCVLGCSPDRRWVVISPGDVPKGSQMFITVEANAIHLRSVRVEGTLLIGDVVDAWVVPKRSVYLTEGAGSPASVAGHFRWPRSTAIAKTRISIELAQVQSAVFLMDEDWKETDEGGGGFGTLVAVVLLFPVVLILGAVVICSGSSCRLGP